MSALILAAAIATPCLRPHPRHKHVPQQSPVCAPLPTASRLPPEPEIEPGTIAPVTRYVTITVQAPQNFCTAYDPVPWQGFVGGRQVRAAPELDPGALSSGVTLLIGCIAVIRGRKP